SDALLDSATNTFVSSNVPYGIPDYPDGPATSVLSVSGTSGVVEHVSITFSITHTYDGDLTGTLISPLGKRVQLFSYVGGAGQNFTNTTIDDDAVTFIGDASAPFTGSYIPSGLLSSFSGRSANGTWTFEIKDGG